MPRKKSKVDVTIAAIKKTAGRPFTTKDLQETTKFSRGYLSVMLSQGINGKNTDPVWQNVRRVDRGVYVYDPTVWNVTATPAEVEQDEQDEQNEVAPDPGFIALELDVVKYLLGRYQDTGAERYVSAADEVVSALVAQVRP